KSPPVRKRMIKQLANNITKLVKGLSEELRVVREWDKIEVVGPEGDAGLEGQVREVLHNTPGIASFSLVRRYALGDLDQMYQQTMTHWGAALAGKTFCVRVKRTGKHDFTSNEVEQYVGGGLNQNTEATGVKLKHPDVTVRLEIKDDNFYVIENTEPGLGGFPIGTQDSVISLISGGFDSNVASYLCMKRGLRTHFLFFNLGGRAHELGVKEVAHFL
ncbi:MAG: THUMP domain-containing protein, partial [Porticoccaceae bacterium]|nr:THUMP domain-containing protein [Porticoccaceae bacterium]